VKFLLKIEISPAFCAAKEKATQIDDSNLCAA
jgi:hypothetical protein